MSSYQQASVSSADGTSIGVRRTGSGPAITLVQGAVGTTADYHELADALGDRFTVHTPERRGRPLSPAPFDPAHVVDREIEDLQAVLAAGDCRRVFGLSSGAVIAIEAARRLPELEKVILYEPPLYVPPRRMDLAMVERFTASLDEDRISAAMLSALIASGLAPALVRAAPRALVETLLDLYLRLDARKKARRYPPLRELVPTMRFDFGVVTAMQDRFESFRSIRADVLLLSCRRSPAYLREACARLAEVIPSSRAIEFAALDHSGPWNRDKGGRPAVVAAAIRDCLLT